MNKQDIRIGNLVRFKDDIAIVEQIGNFILARSRKYPHGHITNPESINPIQLTDELIDLLGFTKEVYFEDIGDGYTYEKTITIAEFDYRIVVEYDFSLSIEDNKDNFNMPIHERDIYLHELQNLYYDLTETELDVSKIIDKHIK